MIKHFKANTKGRDLIIGDIHGCFSKAMAALHNVGFDFAVDRLFSVGDLVDRGPESVFVLDWLDKPWFHAVRGNHEQMVIDGGNPFAGGDHMHMINGGAWFVGMTRQERQPYVDAIACLPVAITLDTAEGPIGIIHADPVADDWARTTALLGSANPEEGFVQACIWSRDRVNSAFDGVIAGVRAVVVGHTPMQRMTSLGNVIYIDTGGWITREPGRQFTVIDAATLAPAYCPVLEFGA